MNMAAKNPTLAYYAENEEAFAASTVGVNLSATRLKFVHTMARRPHTCARENDA